MIKVELSENQSNARKLSALTNDSFKIMQDSLMAQHANILEHWNNPKKLENVVTTVKKGNFNFNSVTVIGSDGRGRANSPNLNLVGKLINTKGVKEGLRLRKNFISDPYIGPNDKLMLIVSTALYKNDQYLGMVNGLVWLQEKNFLTHLLEETYGNEQPDVLVYDRSNTFIYHEEKQKIGSRITNNQFTDDLSKSDDTIFQGSGGESYLAGHATVPISQWHIISMTPEKEALMPAMTSSIRALLIAVPFIIVMLVVLFFLIAFITKPLDHLANFNYEKPIAELAEKSGELHAPYREVDNIKKMILSFVRNQKELLDELEELSVTDPLTGLANRRRLNQVVGEIKLSGKPFGYIVLDIDRFKQINDTYGHTVGDQVLVRLSNLIQSTVCESGLPVRTGGEEFAIVLQNTSPHEIVIFAEKLRKEVEKTDFYISQSITISLGVGYLDCNTYDVSVFYEEVDRQLYKAKQSGRNRVETVFINAEHKHIS